MKKRYDSIPPPVSENLQELLDRHSVLVFRDVQIDDAAFEAFGRSFGELEDYGYLSGKSQCSVRLSNLDENRHFAGLTIRSESRSLPMPYGIPTTPTVQTGRAIGRRPDDHPGCRNLACEAMPRAFRCRCSMSQPLEAIK